MQVGVQMLHVGRGGGSVRSGLGASDGCRADSRRAGDVFARDGGRRITEIFLDSVFRARICEVDEQLYQDDESLKPRAAGAAFCRRRSDARRVDHATAMNRLESMLAPFRKPAAEIICRPEICGIAASKLGGRPFLPENFGIPRVAVTPETKADGTAGREMRLAAQINFAEMSLPGFPESGLLQLWISPGFGNKLGSTHKFCRFTVSSEHRMNSGLYTIRETMTFRLRKARNRNHAQSSSRL